MRLGYTDEAAAFMRWVEARCEELEPDGSLQIMYGIDGRHELPEETLPHLEGYMGSRPVRIGNAASPHLQLDIYGELMDSIYLYDKYGAADLATTSGERRPPHRLGVRHWREPDESIWEVRGGRQEFLYSRVMCWVAIDRAIRLAQQALASRRRSARWHDVRDAIYQRHLRPTSGTRSAERSCSTKGATTLDAVGAAHAARPLHLPDGPALALDPARHRAGPGERLARLPLPPGRRRSPTASPATRARSRMCSFWYVECLSRLGDLQQARFYFEKMLGYANHLGLYGEELGPAASTSATSRRPSPTSR